MVKIWYSKVIYPKNLTMDNDILASKITQKKIDTYTNHVPQSLIIVGPKYSGKKHLVKKMVKLIKDKQRKKVQLIIVEKEIDKRTIGIDQIRYIKKQLSLRDENIRIIMITDAEELTKESQNSLLKILEEPPQNTHFIFTISNESNIINTIKSRSVIWTINLPAIEDIENKYNPDNDKEISKYILMSNRRIGLLTNLINSQEKSIIEAFDLSKDILKTSEKDRLKIIKNIDINFDSANSLLDALEIVCVSALENSIKNSSPTNKIIKWNSTLKEIIKSREYISRKAQPKLVLAKMFLVI